MVGSNSPLACISALGLRVRSHLARATDLSSPIEPSPKGKRLRLWMLRTSPSNRVRSVIPPNTSDKATQHPTPPHPTNATEGVWSPRLAWRSYKGLVGSRTSLSGIGGASNTVSGVISSGSGSTSASSLAALSSASCSGVSSTKAGLFTGSNRSLSNLRRGIPHLRYSKDCRYFLFDKLASVPYYRGILSLPPLNSPPIRDDVAVSPLPTGQQLKWDWRYLLQEGRPILLRVSVQGTVQVYNLHPSTYYPL